MKTNFIHTTKQILMILYLNKESPIRRGEKVDKVLFFLQISQFFAKISSK